MSRIKICGLSRIEDILAVNCAMPDYIGFVFAQSKRRVSPAQASLLKEKLNNRIKAVGVFVNEQISSIKRLCEDRVIDAVQLHGDEDQGYIIRLKQEIACPIIKAVRVKDEQEIADADKLECDFLLFDTYCKESYGGTGKAFDWSMVMGINKPFFLAGGIGYHNAEEAVRTLQPYCVDVSSLVETNGIKDKAKIIEMVKQIRRER